MMKNRELIETLSKMDWDAEVSIEEEKDLLFIEGNQFKIGLVRSFTNINKSQIRLCFIPKDQ